MLLEIQPNEKATAITHKEVMKNGKNDRTPTLNVSNNANIVQDEKIDPSKSSSSTCTATEAVASLNASADTTTNTTSSNDETATNINKDKQVVGWEEVKKARNRINSQRTRERERTQIKSLEAERARLWLSNDAIKFQNQHYRDTIARILEVTKINRGTAASDIGRMGNDSVPSLRHNNNCSSNSNNNRSNKSSSINDNNNNNNNNNNRGMISGMNGFDPLGTAHKGLFGSSSRLQSSASNLNGRSDVDILAARHQFRALEMQNMMMRQQAGTAAVGGNMNIGAMQMGTLNMNNIGMQSVDGRVGTNSSNLSSSTSSAARSGAGPINDFSNINMSNINMNNINMNMNMNGLNNPRILGMGGAVAPTSFGDVADNIRIRQLMLQHSATAGDFEPKGLLSNSSISNNNAVVGGPVSAVNMNMNMNMNMNNHSDSLDDTIGGLSGLGALGDTATITGNNNGGGTGLIDSDILQQMTKRQKFGF